LYSTKAVPEEERLFLFEQLAADSQIT